MAIYNAFMGAVDKSDILLSLYRTRFRTRKWYLRIVFHLFSLSAVNGWNIYRQLGGNESLLKFLGKICFSLIKGSVEPASINEGSGEESTIYRSMRGNDALLSIRHDRYNHWPLVMDVPNSQRCKNKDCKKKTKYQGTKCHMAYVFLCITANDCFRKYHTVV